MAFETVAVNLLELAISPGLEAIIAIGGLAAFTGWTGAICGLLLAAEAGNPPGEGDREDEGWRARRLPTITRRADDELTVRSWVDGSTHHLRASELLLAGGPLGARTATELVPGGVELNWWRRIDDIAPPTGWVVSSVPADAARDGMYRTQAGWSSIADSEDAATPGPLVAGCACRACDVASAGYLGHLWRQREITALHLLGWHNLHQVRRLVEGG